MAIPRATARLQLHKEFTFDDAAAVVPYYASLGVSHIYASPILTARSGSTHGYDIVDPTRINPELGGEEGLRRFNAALRDNGLGMILDIVPNHMGVGAENPWWQHVLEWGQRSPYARWFDIDWQPTDETLHGRVMAPFLGQPYGDALAAGEIQLQFDAARGKFFIAYYGQCFPVAPASYAGILRCAGSELLDAVIAAFDEGRDEAGEIPQQSAEAGIALLRQLAQSEEGMSAIRGALEQFEPAAPAGFEALHDLLERQHYRLAWWRRAPDGINWRRFFEVTELIGVRVEQDDVFEATHALIFRLYTEGLIDGVRIDHVDGLADPGAYCRKLRRRLQALAAQRPPELPPGPAYLIVEKILAPDEQLRDNWEIDGTSGYDFMDRVGALMHDPQGTAPLTELWTELTGQSGDFLAEVHQARRQLLSINLAGEFEAASRALHALARTDLRTRDFPLGAIRRVFTELLVHFPVYRTYADSNGRDELDQQVMDRALEGARQSVERTEVPLLDFLARWLGGDAPRDAANPRVRALHQRAITRFQQLTPPLAAKSVEDTAFYRYGRLLSRNEVGADPGQFSISVDEFHQANQVRLARFPDSMLATATHDHKRGEDVRMRIALLSEIADDWCRQVRDWMGLNARHRRDIADAGAPPCIAPGPADELMLYQMIVGAWPLDLNVDDKEGLRAFAARLEQWQTKALREAKLVSDWVLPNESYEAACRDFLHAILLPDAGNVFLPRVAAWIDRIAPAAAAKSLAQTVLRLTCPGMPDLYQGTEFWDFSLVDPDNRRPVDYAARCRALEQFAPQIDDAGHWRSGILKQQLIRAVLAHRAAYPELFSRAEYVPLAVQGEQARCVIAFARQWQDRRLIVIACHLPGGSMGEADMPAIANKAWGDTVVELPAGWASDWRDIVAGARAGAENGRLRLGEAFQMLPVAVLEGGG